MTHHCWLCDTDVELDEHGRCENCDELWRDPADGPTERQIEQQMDRWPERPFTMFDKDAPERYRP